MKKLLFVLLWLMFFSAIVVAGGQSEPSSDRSASSTRVERVRLATTTSTENSGLLDFILPVFNESFGFSVDVVAVGTGAALELGRNGDADVVMVHARSLEDEFVAAGHGVNRRDIMYNDFVILGPRDDPADIANASSGADAMARIAGSSELFISRGDNSGTHNRERALWRSAGVEPSGSWYREVGQGMGPVITISNEELAYTIADRGTFLSYRDQIDLVVLYQGDPSLFNPYGVIAINPERYPESNYVGAMALIAFLTSPDGQGLIGDYRVNGEVLFTPSTAGN